MAEVAGLKTARATAKSQFTRAEKKLNESLINIGEENEKVPVATIKRRFDDLSTRWDNAQDAHDAYAAALAANNTPEDQLTTEETWLTEISERFDRLEVAVDQYMEKVDKAAKDAQLAVPPVQATT